MAGRHKKWSNEKGIPKIKHNNILYTLKTNEPIIVYKKVRKNIDEYYMKVDVENKVYFKRLAFKKDVKVEHKTLIKILCGREVLYPEPYRNYDPVHVIFITHFEILELPKRDEKYDISQYFSDRLNKYKKV